MRHIMTNRIGYSARVMTRVLAVILSVLVNAPSFAQNGGDIPVIDWSLLNPPTDEDAKSAAQRKAERDNFYKHCIASPAPALSLGDHLAMCACVDAHRVVYESRTNDPDWRSRVRGRDSDEYTDFNVNVVAPCLYIMGKYVSDQGCYTAHYRNMFRDPPALAGFCACRADSITAYMKDTAAPHLAAMAAEGRKIGDALSVLRADVDFRKQINYLTQSCVKKYYDPNRPSRNAPRSGGYYNG